MGKIIFPTLYARTRTGKIKTYRIEVVHLKDYSEIHRFHASKEGGKVQLDIMLVGSGTNIGKANEKSIKEQAEFIADSMVRALKDQGYKESKSEVGEANTDASGNIKPMLAQGYREDIKFPAYVQRKYDGVRCLAFWKGDSIVLLSRKGKPYVIPHIIESLQKVLDKGHILDGELYKDGISFQDILSGVKAQKTKSAHTEKIEYHIYDVAVSAAPFSKRKELLARYDAKIKAAKKNALVVVPTYEVSSKEEIAKYFKDFVRSGYEGVMVRTSYGVYDFGFRSPDLMKYKEMQDEEFKIIDVVQATGRDAGTGIFVCRTGKQVFNVRPKGTLEERKAYWRNRKKLIGHHLTVQFQEYTELGVPRFPVGISVRNYE